MTYRKTINKAGRTMYYQNGKLVKQGDVPIIVLESNVFDQPIEIAEMPTVSEMTPEAIHPERKCVFCGQYGKFTKFIHGMTVYLCQEDYQTKSTGAVGGKVRELYA